MKKDILLCPICKRKTRTQVREDTTLTNYPLFCPKCKHETLVNVRKMNMEILKEPAASAQKSPPQSR